MTNTPSFPATYAVATLVSENSRDGRLQTASQVPFFLADVSSERNAMLAGRPPAKFITFATAAQPLPQGVTHQ